MSTEIAAMMTLPVREMADLERVRDAVVNAVGAGTGEDADWNDEAVLALFDAVEVLMPAVRRTADRIAADGNDGVALAMVANEHGIVEAARLELQVALRWQDARRNLIARHGPVVADQVLRIAAGIAVYDDVPGLAD